VTAPADAPVVKSARLRWFALALVGLPVVLLGSSFWLASTDWFVAHATPAYLRWMDAQYSVQGRDCEVLIFGDSTALTGLEPKIIAQQTGMTACSIAQTRGVVGALGTELVDRYLEKNPAPRYMVFAFSPDNWHRQREWDEIAFGEGMFLELRHTPAREWLKAAVMHPAIAFSFALHVDELVLGKAVGRALGWAPMQLGPDPGLELGHMTMNFPAEEHCESRDVRVRAAPRLPDAVYMAELRAKYSRSGGAETNPTTVLLVASPVPDCDPEAEWYGTRLAGRLDFPLRQYPIGDFNSFDRHFTRAGSERYSAEVAAMIRSKQATDKVEGKNQGP
jgi:hypothetical protein